MKVQTTVTIKVKDIELKLTKAEAKELLNALRRELGDDLVTYRYPEKLGPNPWNPWDKKVYYDDSAG